MPLISEKIVSSPPSVSLVSNKSAGPQASDLSVSHVSPRVSEPVSDLESSAMKAFVTVEVSTTPGLTNEEPSPSKHEAPSTTQSIPVKATESQSRRAKAETPAGGSTTSKVIPFSKSSLGKSPVQDLEKGTCSVADPVQKDHQKTKIREESDDDHLIKDSVSVGIMTDSSDIDSSEAEMERQRAEKAVRAASSGSKKKQKKKKSKPGKGLKSH
ncbi:hypothetical protein DY000_02046518 [Brassica cretica]|uniref:Uncharacterized protein n=1 Tax=Brassica cretica TaxID=69181 RepID=A0ABQ7F2N1_BRACR|nr:hypothetical protein DY000_02046518 [Brassica cretica]